jgi:hypothetical protein
MCGVLEMDSHTRKQLPPQPIRRRSPAAEQSGAFLKVLAAMAESVAVREEEQEDAWRVDAARNPRRKAK